MTKVYRETRTIVREFIKWDHGVRTVVKPAEYTVIDVEIDIDGIFQSLGRKAAASKGGRSVEAGGLIVARRRKGF